jgi:ankyrin repeat protein
MAFLASDSTPPCPAGVGEGWPSDHREHDESNGSLTSDLLEKLTLDEKLKSMQSLPEDPNERFAKVLRVVFNAGFGTDVLPAATVCKESYWDADLWDRVIKLPLKIRYRWQRMRFTRLIAAARQDRRDRVKWLLDRRADPDQVASIHGMTALATACSAKRLDAVLIMQMLKAGADSNKLSGDVLVDGEHERISPLQFLVSRHGDVDTTSENEDITIETAKLLMAHGAKLMLRSEPSGRLAVHDATRRGLHKLAKFLIEADTSGRSLDLGCFRHWQRPLHIAVRRDDKDFAFWLIERGAKVIQPDRHGSSPVYLALFQGNEELALNLLKRAKDEFLAALQSERGDDASAARLLLPIACRRGLHQPAIWILDNVPSVASLRLDLEGRAGKTPLAFAFWCTQGRYDHYHSDEMASRPDFEESASRLPLQDDSGILVMKIHTPSMATVEALCRAGARRDLALYSLLRSNVTEDVALSFLRVCGGDWRSCLAEEKAKYSEKKDYPHGCLHQSLELAAGMGFSKVVALVQEGELAVHKE